MKINEYYEFKGFLGSDFYFHAKEDHGYGRVKGDEVLIRNNGTVSFFENVNAPTSKYSKSSKEKFEAAKLKATQ
jgi:hypothetical protein